MPTVEEFGEYLRVARPEHVWYGGRDGQLHILHAPCAGRVATLQPEGFSPMQNVPAPLVASRDGRRLYFLQWIGPSVAPWLAAFFDELECIFAQRGGTAG